MKMIIAFAALVAVAVSAPVGDAEVKIVGELPVDNTGFSDYKYGYQLSNGATREESGQLVSDGPKEQHYDVTGSYSWVDPVTNVQYTVKYTAGKGGFEAIGDHLPK